MTAQESPLAAAEGLVRQIVWNLERQLLACLACCRAQLAGGSLRFSAKFSRSLQPPSHRLLRVELHGCAVGLLAEAALCSYLHLSSLAGRFGTLTGPSAAKCVTLGCEVGGAGALVREVTEQQVTHRHLRGLRHLRKPLLHRSASQRAAEGLISL